MVVTIHQPEFMPWLGFFDKISRSEVFVVLDCVQFRKNYFQNRNKVRTSDGWCWISVPVKTKGKSKNLIKDVEINNNDKKWRKKIWKTIYFNYLNAPFFERYSNFIESFFQKEWESLSSLNEALIRYFLDELGINMKIIKASELEPQGNKSDLVLDICLKTDATTYISGAFGKNYLDEKEFTKRGIKIIYHDFKHPVYQQVFKPFISNMSIIDLLFCCGEETLSVIKGKS